MLNLDLNEDEYDLTIYVPTKGRPENALRLQDQFYKTINLVSRIVFIKSLNDPKLDHYTDLQDSISVMPKQPGFVSPLNLGYLQDRRSVYSYAVGFMGDDHFPRTVGWDEILLQELVKMKSGFVYGDDKFQGENIPTQVVMTSDIPSCLGFMTLPQLKHLYADNFWLAFGKAIGKIKYVPEAVIEHLHPAAGKASHDAGYEFSGGYSLDCEDRSVYEAYLLNDFHSHVSMVTSMLRRTRKL